MPGMLSGNLHSETPGLRLADSLHKTKSEVKKAHTPALVAIVKRPLTQRLQLHLDPMRQLSHLIAREIACTIVTVRFWWEVRQGPC